jgi:hypothetical protein
MSEMPCGCLGHADNAELCRYPSLEALCRLLQQRLDASVRAGWATQGAAFDLLKDGLAKEIHQAKQNLLMVNAGSPLETQFRGYIEGLEFALRLAARPTPQEETKP